MFTIKVLFILMLASNAGDYGVEHATQIATFDTLEDCQGAAEAINSVTDQEYAFCPHQQ